MAEQSKPMGVCNQMTDKNNHISDKSTSTIRPNWHLHLKPSVHPVQSYTLELVLPICTCRSLQNSFLREANCMKIKNSIQRYCSPLFFLTWERCVLSGCFCVCSSPKEALLEATMPERHFLAGKEVISVEF